jgi:hypothetical protein
MLIFLGVFFVVGAVVLIYKVLFEDMVKFMARPILYQLGYEEVDVDDAFEVMGAPWRFLQIRRRRKK